MDEQDARDTKTKPQSFEWIVGLLLMIVLCMASVIMGLLFDPERGAAEASAPCPACVCRLDTAAMDRAAESAANKSAARVLEAFKPRP